MKIELLHTSGYIYFYRRILKDATKLTLTYSYVIRLFYMSDSSTIFLNETNIVLKSL